MRVWPGARADATLRLTSSVKLWASVGGGKQGGLPARVAKKEQGMTSSAVEFCVPSVDDRREAQPVWA